MTLEQAAEKQYIKFMEMTLQDCYSPSRVNMLSWKDLPEISRKAWKEIVRTCPRPRKK